MFEIHFVNYFARPEFLWACVALAAIIILHVILARKFKSKNRDTREGLYAAFSMVYVLVIGFGFILPGVKGTVMADADTKIEAIENQGYSDVVDAGSYYVASKDGNFVRLSLVEVEDNLWTILEREK